MDDALTLLIALCHYYEEHNIPIWRQDGLWSIVRRAQTTLNEMRALKSRRRLLKFMSDESLQGKKSDEDLTEPLSSQSFIIEKSSLYYRSDFLNAHI